MPIVRHDMIACYVARPDAAGTSHEFLQLLRHADDYLGGTWQTIYGTTDSPTETLCETVLREMQEEIALSPRELYRLPTVRAFYVPESDTVHHCTRFCALVGRDTQIVLNHEHTEYRWLARDDAMAHFMWATDRDALAEACRDILDASIAKPYLQIDLASLGRGRTP